VLQIEVESASFARTAECGKQRRIRLADEPAADNHRDRIGQPTGAGEAADVVGEAFRLRVHELSHNRVVIDELQN
jgi:hypothetical protein